MQKLLLMITLALGLVGCASQAQQVIDDANITATVKTRLASYATINALKINVDTFAWQCHLDRHRAFCR